MFNRIISIDWSGAGSESQGVDLRVAHHIATSDTFEIVDRPYTSRTIYSWTRELCRRWLTEQLKGSVPTLVAMDFGFGWPWGSDRAIFGVAGWREMVREVAAIYDRFGTSRGAAHSINDFEKFHSHGPFRFDECRSDFRFYVDHQVPYFRLTELVAPQGISQWYLGSGGTVGFHTISGLAAINDLLDRRETGDLDFVVWPHETWKPDGKRHVLVESYPSICPMLPDYGPCRDEHQRDSWRALVYLSNANRCGKMEELLSIPEMPFGRVADVSFRDQVSFEGYIIGLR